MDALEGVMLIPPDRGQLLGRAVWKSRYVVISRRGDIKENQSQPSYSKLTSGSRASQPLPKAARDDYCLFIYKTKPPADRQDWEPSYQWPLRDVADCQVQTVAHRKQGPPLPTLIVTITDQQRKRRSSRAAGLITSTKDAASTVLWFRSPNDEPHVSLHEWVRFIMSRKGGPMSPEGPISPILTNPFSPKTRDGSDYFPRPNSGNPNYGRGLQHKSSTATYSTTGAQRERPLTFSSASPSLRSKRSDVSSPSSYNHPAHQLPFTIPGQHYTTVLPSDIPSPTTAGPADYQGEFIEGWTSAQGRSSTVSSPTRGRDSISSPTRGRDSISSHAQQASVTESSSPPAPRETILDRAFQLKCIPGSDSDLPGEEKLSSLARFDALMKEADEKRRQREAAQRAEQAAMRSTFEADDSSDEDVIPESDTESDNSDRYSHDEQDGRSQPSLIPPTTKRALEFIASRHGRGEDDSQPPTRRPMSRNPVSFHGGSMTSLNQTPPLRPHTSHAKSRPNQAVSSDPSSPPMPSNATDMSGVSLAATAAMNRTSDEGTVRPSMDKRKSSSSTKRLSFTEFTKRLSSTSSLLLVQTNASSGSSREGGESPGFNQQQHHMSGNTVPRTPAGVRTSMGPTSRDREEHDNKCGWRSSVIGTEGGFL